MDRPHSMDTRIIRRKRLRETISTQTRRKTIFKENTKNKNTNANNESKKRIVNALYSYEYNASAEGSLGYRSVKEARFKLIPLVIGRPQGQVRE